ncbi:MAG: hypothetical protein MUF48_23545, partial [Pirellulaceae bacterium]|nr:hypothetical protein [Pirellulaceae bacterium]
PGKRRPLSFFRAVAHETAIATVTERNVVLSGTGGNGALSPPFPLLPPVSQRRRAFCHPLRLKQFAVNCPCAMRVVIDAARDPDDNAGRPAD